MCQFICDDHHKPDRIEGKMENKVFLIDKKKLRIFCIISGIFFMAVGILKFIIDYEKLGSIEWVFIIFYFTYGIFFLFYGFMKLRIYLKMDIDHLTIKWENKIGRQIIPVSKIDRIVLNDSILELKLKDGISKKFSFINIQYKNVQNLKAFLNEHFSDKIT